ncbi:CAP domain-containing protein [Halosegnis marinus]|uniref:CAP domain-containing protein n=1 Tax=Halosegnis marinus TaxID=3034023 RepID=UPI003605E01C
MATVFAAGLVQFGVAGAIVEGIGDSVRTPASPTTSPTPSDHLDTDGEWRFGIDRDLRAPYTSVDVESRNVHFTQLETMAFVNAQRAERGLDPLFWNERLSQLNRWHARRIYEGQGFAHVNPNTGRNWGERAEWAGYPATSRCDVYGEVITTGGYSPGVTHVERNAAIIVEAWMRSEGHREQILHERYDVGGVGLFVGEGGSRVAVMTMCDRRYLSEEALDPSDARFRNNETVIPYEVAVRDGAWDPTGNLTETPTNE